MSHIWKWSSKIRGSLPLTQWKNLGQNCIFSFGFRWRHDISVNIFKKSKLLTNGKKIFNYEGSPISLHIPQNFVNFITQTARFSVLFSSTLCKFRIFVIISLIVYTKVIKGNPDKFRHMFWNEPDLKMHVENVGDSFLLKRWRLKTAYFRVVLRRPMSANNFRTYTQCRVMLYCVAKRQSVVV